jgi:hypothetical protein
MNYSKLEYWRTHEYSRIGLLSAALQGFGVKSILSDANTCDESNWKLNAKSNSNHSSETELKFFMIGNVTQKDEMSFWNFKNDFQLFSKCIQYASSIDISPFSADAALIVLFEHFIFFNIFIANVNFEIELRI